MDIGEGGYMGDKLLRDVPGAVMDRGDCTRAPSIHTLDALMLQGQRL